MVTITNVHLRKGGNGNFMSLELQGDVELIQSMTTGRHYATAKKCFISSTFSEEQAKTLVGSKLPGSVIKVESDPYDFTIPETGEVVQLAHSYTYAPEEVNSSERIVKILNYV